MSRKVKMIIMAIVAFVVIATVAVIIIMTNSSEKAEGNNIPSTVAATESVTQATDETVDDNELEIIIDDSDNSSVNNNNGSNEKNDVENKPTLGNHKVEVNDEETFVEKTTQSVTTEVKNNADSKEEVTEEPTVDYEQSVEDAINGKGDPIVLPILPVD